MEDLVHNFSTEESHLVKSFWAGKLIQDLQLAEGNPLLASQTSPRKSPSQILIDAFQCVERHETSLSPRVHSIIVGGRNREVHSSIEKGRLLCSNGTLDWSEVTKILDGGETK